jgi:tRNA (cmo5U34)-methyltransferase
MSTPPPQPVWQREHVVASFADRRRTLVPLLELQEDVLARVLAGNARPIARFLDLGCGAGAVSELVLATQSGSSGVLLDFSEPMLERVAATLADYDGRWRVVRGDLARQSWWDELPEGRYDAIVSGLAIHHLSAARKRALFAEAFALLEPGGVFVNMDYVAIDGPLRGLFDEQMAANADHAAAAHGGEAQNVDFDGDEDQPDTVADQLAWLRDAGFEQTEVHFKWAEAAVYGGVRPKGDV